MAKRFFFEITFKLNGTSLGLEKRKMAQISRAFSKVKTVYYITLRIFVHVKSLSEVAFHNYFRYIFNNELCCLIDSDLRILVLQDKGESETWGLVH